MRTIAKYPFIYFLIEPAVFVYQIKSHQYVAAADLRNLQPYELIPGTDFDTFNHHDFTPLEGRGYFIGQDDLRTMQEMINFYIQKNRKQASAEPVHIAISESAAGSLRYALERPKKVIAIPDFLSVGPIWRLDEKAGREFRFEWVFEHLNTEQERNDYEVRFANAIREIEDIREGVPIYLWTADNASEQTGLRFILKLLEGKENDILILLSKCTYTSQAEPEELKSIYDCHKGETPLSIEGKNRYLSEWNSLAQKHDVLRLMIHNEIASLPEDHFDKMILDAIQELQIEKGPEEFIKAGMIIGEILYLMKEPISDSFLEYRLRHLIYSGVLELKGVPKSMRHSGVRLRKDVL